MGRSSEEARAQARRRSAESDPTARQGTTAAEVASDLAAEDPHVAEGTVTEELFQPPSLDDYLMVEAVDAADDVDPPFEEQKDSSQSDPLEDSDDELRIVVDDALTDAQADAPPETLRNEELYEEESTPPPPTQVTSRRWAHQEQPLSNPPPPPVRPPLPQDSSFTNRPLASPILRHSSMSRMT